MLKFGYIISAAAGVWLLIVGLTGCASAPNTQTAQTAAAVELVSFSAAYDGARLALTNNPDVRPKLEAGLAGFRALASRTNYSAAEFSARLSELPALSGSSGAIYGAQAGVLVFSLAAGWIDLEQRPLLAAALRGVCAGLSKALGP